MSRRVWVLIAAIGLALCATLVLAQQIGPQAQIHRQAVQAETETKPSEKDVPLQGAPRPGNVGALNHDWTEAKNADQKASSPTCSIRWGSLSIPLDDSCAQWLAAAMAAVANLISFVAVLLVLLSLGQTRKALSHAKDANKISRLGQRPWLNFEIVEFGAFQITTAANHPWVCLCFPRVKIENKGKSPAVDVKFNLTVLRGKGYESDVEVEVILQKLTEKRQPTHVVAFPDEHTDWERTGAGGAVRDIKNVSDAGEGGTFFLIATVLYWFEGSFFYSMRTYTCEHPPLAMGCHQSVFMNPVEFRYAAIFS